MAHIHQSASLLMILEKKTINESKTELLLSYKINDKNGVPQEDKMLITINSGIFYFHDLQENEECVITIEARKTLKQSLYGN